MRNATAVAASAGMVLAVAGVSGVLYASAAPGSGTNDVPATPAVVVEYVDERGNVVPIEATVVTPGAIPDSTIDTATEVAQGYDDEGDSYDEEHESDGHEDGEYEGEGEGEGEGEHDDEEYERDGHEESEQDDDSAGYEDDDDE